MPRVLPVVLPLLVVLLLAPFGSVQAEDEPRVADLLREARRQEYSEKNPVAAEAAYREVLKRGPELRHNERVLATWGVLRSLIAQNAGDERDKRLRTWIRYVSEQQSLPEELREAAEQARGMLPKPKPVAPPRPDDTARQVERVLKQQNDNRRAAAGALLRLARQDYARSRFEDARSKCYEALGKLGTDSEDKPLADDIKQLLARIQQEMPNREDLIGSLIQFLQTSQLQEYRTLKERIRQLYEAGRRRFEREEYVEADAFWRRAVQFIDESGFLAADTAIAEESFVVDRKRLVAWLEVTRDKAAAQGHTLEDPPSVELAAKTPGVQSAFFELLAKVFAAGSDAGTPLRFYEFTRAKEAGEPSSDDGTGGAARPVRVMSSGNFPSAYLSIEPGTGSRAAWVEGWLLAKVAEARPRGEGASAGPGGRGQARKPRILRRFDNLLCVQNNERVHARVEELRQAFGEVLQPMTVSIELFAASAAGLVASAEELRTGVPGEYVGETLIVPRRQIPDCTSLLKRIEPSRMVHLGQAEASLGADGSAAFHIKANTVEHPSFTDVKPPRLSLPVELATYGLELDLFVEDLTDLSSRFRMAAIQVDGRVSEPGGSRLAPQMGGDRYVRLPRLVRHNAKSIEMLPHDATMVLYGLRNPFPDTRGELPHLVVLIGVRPTGQGASADPAPLSAEPPRIVRGGGSLKHHHLGSLVTEVQDDFVPEGWPDREAASVPAPFEDRIASRHRYLVGWIGEQARVEGEEGNPLRIEQDRVSAELIPRQHDAVSRAVYRLRRHENELYKIEIRSAPTSRSELATLLELTGVDPGGTDVWVVQRGALATIEQRLEANTSSNLFSHQGMLMARATQQVAFRGLQMKTIVRDQQIRDLGQGRKRYTPVMGTVEEGLVVEVRPGIDESGRREISARVRAAAIESIGRTPYPGAGDTGAIVELPRWRVGSPDGLSIARRLSDEEGLLMAVPLPGGRPGDRISVLVRVSRVQ